MRGTGWIHWAKIWFGDLGAYDTEAMAAFPHLEARFNYDKIQYQSAASANVEVAAGFLSEAPLPLLKQMNSSSTNVGGWDACHMRKWLNGQYFDALPIPLQAIIRQARVKATEGNKSSSMLTSLDNVYLAAYAEAFNLTSTDAATQTYISERDAYNHIVPYFVIDTDAGMTSDNNSRCKFPGFILPEDTNYIVAATDPTTPGGVAQTVVSGKTVWINTASSSYGYLYVDADWVAGHKRGAGRLITASENLTAAGADSSGNTGGKWLRSAIWWLRSPNLGNTSHFFYVYTDGGRTNGNASNTYGVVPAFSI